MISQTFNGIAEYDTRGVFWVKEFWYRVSGKCTMQKIDYTIVRVHKNYQFTDVHNIG
jgi:hypothetical protein